MQIIIVSAGVVASRIAAMLLREGHDVTIIDESEAALDAVSLHLDVKTVRGSGMNPRVLTEAGAENADVVVAATRNDELNIIICFVAKELGAKRTVARIQNPDYPASFVAPAKSPTAPRRVIRPKKLGVDLLVNPELLAASHIANTLTNAYITSMETMAEGLIQIGEIEVKRVEATKKPISEIEYPRPAVIAALARSGKTFVPMENESLRLGDRIYVLTERETLNLIGKLFSLPLKPTQNVIIAGGGTVGFFVAEKLEQNGIHVKIIEQNKDRCTEISKKLDKTLVIQGEVTSMEYLRDEGVHSADAFIAAVDRDELNILISVLAKNLGTARSIAVVNRPEYISLAEGIGVDIVVSPLLLANSAFDRFIHQPQILSAAAFARGEAKAIEIPVENGASVIGPSLGKLELPKNTRVAAIIRDDKVLIPRADDFVFAGDRVILVGLRTALPLAEKLFQSK